MPASNATRHRAQVSSQRVGPRHTTIVGQRDADSQEIQAHGAGQRADQAKQVTQVWSRQAVLPLMPVQEVEEEMADRQQRGHE